MAWFLSYYETNAHFKTGLRLLFPSHTEQCPSSAPSAPLC